jgi:PBSX family phage terminase large subunit
MSVALAQPRTRMPYQPYGAALEAWRSGRRECLLAGAAGTGKSRLCLQKLHFAARKYPGMRAIIVRKTRESITQTAMVTYEKKVLQEGWLGSAIKWRTQEQQYEYPNGSVIAVGGMDKSSKVMSSEWDLIYVQEATELFEDDWGALTTRLRNGIMPYQQLIADCNPSYPTHWLKQRADRHEIQMLESRHEDNPYVTPEYIATLDALPGVLKLRLRYGKWAATEGMVYEEWNPAIHILSRSKLVDLGILLDDEKPNFQVVKQVIAGVDWGWQNPGTIQVYALDSDSRAYMIHEIYRTQRDIDWWIEQAVALKQIYHIEQFVCDPAEPSYIEQFNKHGLNAVGAINSIPLGISAAHARLKIAGDGRPRFFVYEYALKERDETRVDAHRPFCFTQEVDGYAWPKSKDGAPVKEVPVKVDDHSMDAFRYFCLWLSDPALTASDHLKDMQRRAELAKQRGVTPVQRVTPASMPILPQKKKAFWEI